MEFKTDASIRVMADVVKMYNLPKIKVVFCKKCDCETKHHIFGTGEDSKGIGYACARCGTVPFGNYEVFMDLCSNCGEERPHVTEYDCGQSVYVCLACGHKHLNPVQKKALEYGASCWEKYHDNPELEDDWYTLKHFKEKGIE